MVEWLGTYNNTKLPDQKLFSDEEVNEIICRCRYLRNIKNETARHLINASAKKWLELFHSYHPSVICTITVDSYITDVLCRLALKLGVNTVGLTGCFISNQFRSSLYGEYKHHRTPSDEEVNSTLDLLTNPSYTPPFMWNKYSRWSFLKRWLKLHIKKGIYRFKQLSDPYNYEYQTVLRELVADQFKLFNYAESVYRTAPIDPLEDKNICYIPLHYFPEATVDYWTPNLDFVKYYETLTELIQQLSKVESIDEIILKEHPGAFGTRPKKVLKHLSSLKKVSLLSSSVSSKSIVKYAKYIITWNGTVGLEAALAGKPAFFLGNPFFYHDKFMNKYSTISALVTSLKNKTFVTGCSSTEEQKELIKLALSGCMPGKFLQRNYQSQENIEIVRDSVKTLMSQF